jgi:hypothetical protein
VRLKSFSIIFILFQKKSIIKSEVAVVTPVIETNPNTSADYDPTKPTVKTILSPAAKNSHASNNFKVGSTSPYTPDPLPKNNRASNNIKVGGAVPYIPDPLPKGSQLAEDNLGNTNPYETETKLWEPEPIDHVVRRYAMKLRDEHRLIWNQSKGLQGALVDHLFMSFYFYQARDIYESRELLVIAVEKLLEALNNPTFVPPTGHDPFTANDLEIEIEFQTFMGKFIDRQYVQYVMMRNGIICYQAFDCLEAPVMCFTRKERYDQAYYMVQLETEARASSSTMVINQGYSEIEINMPIDDVPQTRKSIYEPYTKEASNVIQTVKRAEAKPKSTSPSTSPSSKSSQNSSSKNSSGK